MASQGPKYCSTAADDGTASIRVWSSPTNAQGAADSSYANVSYNGGGILKDFSIKLIKGGSIVGSNLAASATVPSVATWASFGDSTNLWGTTWTSSDINASNFGVAFAIYKNGNLIPSHNILCTNFGFSIPNGATINGILAEVRYFQACFVGGTLVNTPIGKVPIEYLRTGDLIYSFSEDKKIIIDKVSFVTSQTVDTLVNINNEIFCTENHVFFTSNGWQMIQDINVGDVLYTGPEFKPTPVFSKKTLRLPTKVYDISVENNHSFFANNYAVHNITSAINCNLDSTSLTVYYTGGSTSVAIATGMEGNMKGNKFLKGGIRL